jgi:uroporphyrinogen decarboxylase
MKSYERLEISLDRLISNDLQNRISVISECDDLGTQTSTFLEPDYLQKTIIPRFGMLWKHIKKRLPKIKIFMHSCGSVRIVLPDLIEAGLDIYNPVQFTAANMNLKGLN